MVNSTQTLQLLNVTLTGFELETQSSDQLLIPMYFDENIPAEIRTNTANEFAEEYAISFDSGVLIRIEEIGEVRVKDIFFQGGGLWLDKRFDETLDHNCQMPF